MRQKIRFILFALVVGGSVFLSSCLSWKVHPLPSTLGNRPTRDWLERLYVRFDLQDESGQPTFGVDPWLKALSKQGAQVIAYRINSQELPSDPFIKVLSPTAILDVSWRLFPEDIQHHETERKETDAQGKEHVVKESSEIRSQEGKFKVRLTSADQNLVLATDEWSLQAESTDRLDRLGHRALQRWLTPKGSKVSPRPTPPPETLDWFSTRLAVLPFSDEVNNVEAAGLIRVMIFERLHLGGYAVVPLEEVDAALRQHGFTQGGQLKNVHPKQLAQWLGVSRLLYGHLDTFDNITLGIVSKRAVGGKLSLWDQAQGGFLWTNRGLAQDTDTVKHLKGGEILGRFIGQVANKWWGQLTHKPLEAESVQFVDGVLALPLQPPTYSPNLE